MSEDVHSERISNGMSVLFVLFCTALILFLCKVIWDSVIGPNLQFVLKVVAGLIVLAIAAYVIGYIVTDLPDDIMEWWE